MNSAVNSGLPLLDPVASGIYATLFLSLSAFNIGQRALYLRSIQPTWTGAHMKAQLLHPENKSGEVDVFETSFIHSLLQGEKVSLFDNEKKTTNKKSEELTSDTDIGKISAFCIIGGPGTGLAFVFMPLAILSLPTNIWAFAIGFSAANIIGTGIQQSYFLQKLKSGLLHDAPEPSVFHKPLPQRIYYNCVGTPNNGLDKFLINPENELFQIKEAERRRKLNSEKVKKGQSGVLSRKDRIREQMKRDAQEFS